MGKHQFVRTMGSVKRDARKVQKQMVKTDRKAPKQERGATGYPTYHESHNHVRDDR